MIWFIMIGIICFTFGAFVSYCLCEKEISNADKLADVYLISTSPKEIAEYIKTNISGLSDTVRKQLVARIEELNCDQNIHQDDLSKKIDSLEKKIIDESFASKNRKRVEIVYQDKKTDEEFLYPWIEQKKLNENKY